MSHRNVAFAIVFILALVGCGRSNLDPAGTAPQQPAAPEQIFGILFDPAAVDVPTAGSVGLRLLGRTRSGRVDLTGDPRVSFELPPELVRYEGGRLTGLARGEGILRARFRALTAEAAVTVGREHSPTRLRLEPSSLRVGVGHAERFAILADRIEGETDDVTGLPGTELHLEGPVVVAIEGATLRGLAVGTARLVAERKGLRAEAEVVVSRDDADLMRLAVTPSDVELGLDEGLQLVVTGLYRDGASEDFTAQSSATSYTVSDPPLLFAAADGLFFADAPGMATIDVAAHGLHATTSVRIRAGGPRLTGIEPLPGRIQAPLFGTVALRVLGRRDDGSTVELGAATTGTRYRSFDSAIAAVDPDGAVELSAPGLTGIEVEHGRFAALVPVEVLLPPLAGFALVPDFDTITTGESAVLRAVATFADGNTFDVSCGSDYASTNAQVVVPGACGSLVGVIPGDEVVTATAPDGVHTAVARVSVRTRTLERFDGGMPVGPAHVGDTFTVSLLAYYSDGSTEDIARDPETSWRISEPTLLSGVPPTFTALAEGSTLIGLTYRGNDLGFRLEIRPPRPDVIVRAGELLELETLPADAGSVLVEAGGTLRLVGSDAPELGARSIRIDGVLEALATAGVDGFTVAAPGGAGGPGGGGGGGAADGNTRVPAPGGGGENAGGTAASGAGPGTQAGAGGGEAGGLGAGGGCAQGGGGGANAGPGGAGGGDAGPGTGARGGFGDAGAVRGGSGGGGGSTCGDSSGGGGGGGGARLRLSARTVEISGTIRADGARGGAGYPGTGAGGGGSGGAILLDVRDRLVVTGTLSARGAPGGGSTDGDAGGGGGGGLIRLSSTGSLDFDHATFDLSGGAGGVATAGGFDGLAGGHGVVILPDAG